MGRKPGEPATAKQRAAGLANFEKGRQARKEALAQPGPTTKERWAMLLSGQLSVKDLDDEEIQKMALKGKGGKFQGGRRAVPSHLIAAFEAERRVRWKRDILDAVPDAIEALLDIIQDPEHKDRGKHAQWFVEHALGKNPDVLQVQAGSEFDRVAGAAIDIDRGLADDAESFLSEQADVTDVER